MRRILEGYFSVVQLKAISGRRNSQSCWVFNKSAISRKSIRIKGSERTLPLVGCSLWAAERAVEASKHSPYLFPRYCNDKVCKANSASPAVNKWLKQTIGDDYVIHEFWHSIRDRSRAEKCPTEMIDQMGGWSKRSVGEGYDEGYKISQLRACILNLEKTVY